MTTAKQQRKNRLHLADMLENRITDEQFDMRHFTNACGTVGCALGIAALSGEFGYGWRPDPSHYSGVGDAVKDGKIVMWNAMGYDLFGDRATEDIFYESRARSRQTVAAELRAIK